MESTAATAASEGRYAALLGSAERLSSGELLDVIEVAQREKDAASARQAVALAHLSALDDHRQEDGTVVEVHHGLGHQRLDGPELVAPRLGVSVHVASNRILDAIRQMVRTPAVVDAMASGDLCEQRARVVTEETEFLSPESAAAVVALVEPVWGQLTVGPLRQLLARTAAQVDPDAVTAHAEDERARRGLTRRMGVHGTDHWRGDFRVEQARGAWAAVTERARQLVREGLADSLELGRADAMMELILEHSDVKVVVHTTRAADDDTQPASATASSPGTTTSSGTARTSTTSEPAAANAAPKPAAPDRARSADAASDTRRTSDTDETDETVPSEGPATSASKATPDSTTPAAAASDRTSSVNTPGSAAASAKASGRTGSAAAASAAAAPTATSGVEDLVEVGGLGGPGTTFVPRDWIDDQGATDPERPLVCDDDTGALLTGDVPASLARGQDAARRAHRARERAKEKAERPGAPEPVGVPAPQVVAADTRFAEAGTGTRSPSGTRDVTDPGEDAVDFSAAYRVPDPMARLVRLRDGACRFPGCAVTAHQCDLDHVKPWPAGPTTPTNLMALCRRHHRIKQRNGWTARLHPDATVTWTDPTGLRTTTWPVDHLHLITAGATRRDSTTPSSNHIPVEIPTSFEEALIELLGGPANAAPRAYPTWFDIEGNTYGGPPPRIDLHPRPSWQHLRVDFPPRPPQAPEPIPF